MLRYKLIVQLIVLIMNDNWLLCVNIQTHFACDFVLLPVIIHNNQIIYIYFSI